MNNLSEEDFIKATYQKIYEAEKRMMDQFHSDLFGGPVDPIEFSYQPPSLKEKITTAALKVYCFFRYRVVGVWNVMKNGECGNCDQDDYRWE